MYYGRLLVSLLFLQLKRSHLIGCKAAVFSGSKIRIQSKRTHGKPLKINNFSANGTEHSLNLMELAFADGDLCLGSIFFV